MGEQLPRAEVLQRLARHLVAIERPHPLRVALDGRTAAAKTTLANELVAPIIALGRLALRIEIDDFHLPRTERHGRGPDLTPGLRYYEHSFDNTAIRNALLPLGPGGDRRYRRAAFDSFHDVPIDEPPRLAPPEAVMLLDGGFLMRPELDDLWDVRLFVDIDPRTRCGAVPSAIRAGSARSRRLSRPITSATSPARITTST
jgi:uridine kinase